MIDTTRVAHLEAVSQHLKLERQEPTWDTRCRALATILDLVRERQRKVYGGFAQHLASVACLGEPLYTWERNSASAADADASLPSGLLTSPPDVEFYSPDPARDAIDLADRLALLEGHKYVQAREAMHRGTITVTVHFSRMCDITYMPPAAYALIPTLAWPLPRLAFQTDAAISTTDAAISTDTDADAETEMAAAIVCVAPSYAMIDMLRQVADPVSSHWRLGTVLKRISLLRRIMASDALQHIAPSAHHRAEAEAEEDASASASASAGAGAGASASTDHGTKDEEGGGLDTAQMPSSIAAIDAPGIRRMFSCVAWGDGSLCDGGMDHSEMAHLLEVLRSYEKVLGCRMFVSSNFVQDVHMVRQSLLSGCKYDGDTVVATATVTICEPFLDLLGHSAVIEINGIPAAIIYDYGGIPVPLSFAGSGRKESSGLVPGPAVASFTYVVKHLLALSFQARVVGIGMEDYKHGISVAAEMESVTARLADAMMRLRNAMGIDPLHDTSSPLRDFSLPIMGTSVSTMEAHMLGPPSIVRDAATAASKNRMLHTYGMRQKRPGQHQGNNRAPAAAAASWFRYTPDGAHERDRNSTFAYDTKLGRVLSTGLATSEYMTSGGIV